MSINKRLLPYERRYSRLAREWSNDVLKELALLFSGSVINVSGWRDEDKQGHLYRNYFINATNYAISNHDGARGHDSRLASYRIDLTSTLSQELEHQFDVVFNHTTLEHIFDIRTAFHNLCQLSKDIVIVVVPFAQQLHYTESYGDYWRLTPHSLRKLYAENNLTVIFEAANSDTNAANYLLFIGSRYPERWLQVVPRWEPISKLGDWIGHVEKNDLSTVIYKTKTIVQSLSSLLLNLKGRMLIRKQT